MPKGGEGRKRNMGDLRAFLNWAVLEKKYLGVEWLPLTAKQYAKYVGAVPKGRKKNRTREPILKADFEMLLEALKRENKLGLRAIVVLSAVYGIRISEIANMKIKNNNQRDNGTDLKFLFWIMLSSFLGVSLAVVLAYFISR